MPWNIYYVSQIHILQISPHIITKREAQLKTLSIIHVCPHSTNHFWSRFSVFQHIINIRNVLLTSWSLWFLMIKSTLLLLETRVLSFNLMVKFPLLQNFTRLPVSYIYFKDWALEQKHAGEQSKTDNSVPHYLLGLRFCIKSCTISNQECDIFVLLQIKTGWLNATAI